ncbi:hypothetical protein BHM03_00060563 [Ensete ventricosum]|nr:hypothetical protein BHM03_00060563 [Ensete ventricosum]
MAIPLAYQANLPSAPEWLNKGDNGWQLAAGTLVGLQIMPGLVVLYGSIVKKKWAVNSWPYPPSPPPSSYGCSSTSAWPSASDSSLFGARPALPSARTTSSTTPNRQRSPLLPQWHDGDQDDPAILLIE